MISIESLEGRLFLAAQAVDLFPLTARAWWNYSHKRDGTTSNLRQYISANQETVNGVKTSVMSRGGENTNYSFASGALQEHKERWIEDGQVSFMIFNRPYTMIPATISVGGVFSNTGRNHGITDDGIVWTGRRSHTATVQAQENLLTPAGTFSAYRIRLVIDDNRYASYVDGSEREKQTITLWLSHRVGILKMIVNGTLQRTEGGVAQPSESESFTLTLKSYYVPAVQTSGQALFSTMPMAVPTVADDVLA